MTRLSAPKTLATFGAAAAIAIGLSVASPAASTATGGSKDPAASHATSRAAAKPPAIKHVWVVMLENENYAYSFGAPGKQYAPYLAKNMVAHGALLQDYYGTGHDSLDNYTAAISGQASNYELGQDCGFYSQFVQFGGENFDKWTKYHQLSGEGCVYPKSVKTVANQLQAKHLSWRAYMQDMGNIPHRDKTVMTKNGPACGHPKVNSEDLTDSTGPAKDSYATRHNPFMYFQSVIGNKQLCNGHVLSFKPLAHDLKKVSTTPSFSFISPNTCYDGHDWPKCQDGTPGRLPRVNQFLKKWIPRIEASPAYRKNGLIIVTMDESGHDENAAACCGEVDSLGYDDPSHPNMNEPGVYGPGGGKVGAVLLSPFIKPGTVSSQPYNHFSLLRSVEDIFKLHHLGDAQMPQVHSFGSDIYTRKKG
ncbi:MAG: alkaline phosphatase family protein [Nocardioides sp.]